MEIEYYPVRPRKRKPVVGGKKVVLLADTQADAYVLEAISDAMRGDAPALKQAMVDAGKKVRDKYEGKQSGQAES